MILATVGTHHQPFDRLVEAVEAYAAATGDRVVLQRGPSAVPAPHCETHEWLPPGRLDALAREASVVVTHAGPGSVLQALGVGARVVVVPRDPDRGEHVDDHQRRFARHLAPPVVVLWDATRLRETLESLAAKPVPSEARVHEQRSREFADRLQVVIEDAVRAPRARCPWRVLRAIASGRVG